MPRGKKFDAAEKHFRQKEIEYQRTIRILRDKLKQCNQDKESILVEKLQLEDEKDQLQQWIDRLLEYTELSKEDIRSVCEQDKRRGESLSSLMKMMCSYM